jgi:hypothetical protein
MKTMMIIFGLLVLGLSTPVHGYMEQREFTMDADSLETLNITCGAGGLSVTGSTKVKKIHVTANIDITAKSEAKAAAFAREHIELWMRKSGSEAQLMSKIPKKSTYIRNAVVHLDVTLPARLHLDIHDRSGAITVQAIQGHVHIKDSSGEIDIRDIGGELDIDDESGGIHVRNIQGDVKVKDGSGGILLEHLRGNAVIDDGSGGISVHDVSNNLTIRDGSGNIDVNKVGGNVLVDDGSGSMDIKDVAKEVVINSDSSGTRRISNIGGNIVERQ